MVNIAFFNRVNGKYRIIGEKSMELCFIYIRKAKKKDDSSKSCCSVAFVDCAIGCSLNNRNSGRESGNRLAKGQCPTSWNDSRSGGYEY